MIPFIVFHLSWLNSWRWQAKEGIPDVPLPSPAFQLILVDLGGVLGPDGICNPSTEFWDFPGQQTTPVRTGNHGLMKPKSHIVCKSMEASLRLYRESRYIALDERANASRAPPARLARSPSPVGYGSPAPWLALLRANRVGDARLAVEGCCASSSSHCSHCSHCGAALGS
ncbi:unnamed protein product [Pleuronectes platessa]|uniref:Uncharacterized protein n=1 Tax=Pleuronectes platessa TaxID=8262 RepID=A0A9N7UQR1_PLEPL|nr:unnamed protein product [Pleuronectes platessa]